MQAAVKSFVADYTEYFNKNDSEEARKIDAIKATLRQKQKIIAKKQEKREQNKYNKSLK